jgi:hypothetical protein
VNPRRQAFSPFRISLACHSPALFPSYLLVPRDVANSLSLRKTSTRLFSTNSKLFRQITRKRVFTHASPSEISNTQLFLCGASACSAPARPTGAPQRLSFAVVFAAGKVLRKEAALTTFRMNTCKSVSKQKTLSIFRMNTYVKPGEAGPPPPDSGR